MSIIGPNYVMIRMPKVAGTWMEAVLVNRFPVQEAYVFPDRDRLDWNTNRPRNLVHHYVGEPEGPVPENTAWQIPPKKVGSRAVFTFLRNPYAFLKSYWQFRYYGGWSDWPPDVVMWQFAERDPDFEHFTETIMDRIPGWLSALYRQYTKEASFVGRFEALHDDFAWIMKSLGHECDAEEIRRNFPPFNRSQGEKPEGSERLRALVAATEPEAWALWEAAGPQLDTNGVTSHSLSE